MHKNHTFTKEANGLSHLSLEILSFDLLACMEPAVRPMAVAYFCLVRTYAF